MIDPHRTYLVDGETLTKLRAVERRLYDDKPLSGDQRRDLANTLNALLGACEQFSIPTEGDD